MKNILILIGGWHYPYKFYEQISKLELPIGYNVKKFVTNLNIISDIVNNNVDSYFYLKNKQVNKIKDDNWLHIANCFYEDRFIPRGSFNVFKKELLLNKDLFLKFDNVTLHRNNEIHSPSPENIEVLANWNNVCGNFGKYMLDNNLTDRSYRLSPIRRISNYLLECQRGFLRSLD